MLHEMLVYRIEEAALKDIKQREDEELAREEKIKNFETRDPNKKSVQERAAEKKKEEK